MRVLVTGAAGFIGFHTTAKLLARGDSVVALDSINDYYDPSLKHARLRLLADSDGARDGRYRFVHANMADRKIAEACFSGQRFDRVIHLAAQAGVRYSLVNPHAYVESNLVAFVNLLDACRHAKVPHLTYASSSSVYGANTTLPFREAHSADHPLQFYAATKRANELMAHSYSHLYGLPTTGLRFFTVYGPWGRPDMALFQFTHKILAGEPVQLFNQGRHTRDFTYIDDIVEGVVRASDDVAVGDPAWNAAAPTPDTSAAPFRLFNIGNNRPVELIEYVHAIEQATGRGAIKELLPLQPGDVPDTHADVSALERQVGYRPTTTVREGVARFVRWYREYYGV